MPKFSFSKKKTRLDLNDTGRRLKKKRKHKGLPSGYRHSLVLAKKKKNKTNALQDPRLGSKKSVPLFGESTDAHKSTSNEMEHVYNTAAIHCLEQELSQLENDPKLDDLLTRIESKKSLTKEEKLYVDTTLARIETLMAQLGYEYEDDIDEDNNNDIMRLLKS